MKRNIDFIIGTIILCYAIVLRLLRNGGFAFNREAFFLGIMLIVYHFIKDKLKERIEQCRYSKFLKILIKASILICAGIFIVLEVVIVAFPKYNGDKSDYILVLGAGIENDKPSPILKSRLDKAISLYELHNKTEKIIVSGGKGYDEKIPEAEVMKNYLVKKGVNLNNIIEENKSRNTSENFRFSKKKIENDSGRKIENCNVKIITTDFHSFRSYMIAEKNGYKKVSNDSAKGVWYLTPLMYTREALAIIKSFVFD